MSAGSTKVRSKPLKWAIGLGVTLITTGCGQDKIASSKTDMIIGSNEWDTSADTTDTFPYNGTIVRTANGCSAGYVAGQFVLSVAHCFGASGGTTTLTNRFSGTQSARVWARSNFEGSNVNDWSILVANEPMGLSVGASALDFVPLASGQTTTAIGFPDRLGGTMARSQGSVKEMLDSGQRYGHDADIITGNSGSSMGRLDGGTFRVNGIQSWHWWPDAAASTSQQCATYATGSCANAAVAITQFRMKVAEAKALESLSQLADFDGSGHKQFLERDASGMRVMKVTDAGTLVELSHLSYGSRYGGWLFGADDQVLMVRDFSGNGRAEIFVRSGWGLGLLELDSAGRWNSLAMHPYGTRLGGWLLGANDTIVGAGDFTSDGRQSWVIRSGWGIGLMRLAGGSFETLMLVPHGTVFSGGWTFAEEDAVLGTLPMTYGIDRILLRSSQQGLATLYFDQSDGFKPRVAARMNYGARFPGGWLFNQNDVIVAVGGDMNADGYGEFAIRSGWGFGVIDASLNGVALMPFGSRAPGGWLLGINDQLVGFTLMGADRGHSLLVQSPWGIGLLGASGGQFATRYLASYGTRFEGGWLLGRRDRITAISNLANDNYDEIMIRSGWGLGVLKWDSSASQIKSLALWPNGTSFGSWTLAASDFIPAR